MEYFKRIIIDLLNRFRDLILYGVFGSLSASVDFLVFYLLTDYFSIFYIVANIISVSIGITLSFNLNRWFNFKVKDRYYLRYFIFTMVGFGGLVLSSLILYYLIDILFLSKVVSKLIAIVFVVFIQFLINKFVTFKKQLL